MKNNHLPTREQIASWPEFTAESPCRILFSACLLGELCGVDGSSNGDYPWVKHLGSLPNVRPVRFCPEHFSFGTPRTTPDIHHGDGFKVLEGKAKVLDEFGTDLTQGMIQGAHEMLRVAKENNIHFAIMMDMSGACGSQVISDGSRFVTDRKFQVGAGVAAALLMKNNFIVVSQRDFKTLEFIHHKLSPAHEIKTEALDHHETDWYQKYFKVTL